jgi:DNA-binding Lrp family transcriptional regulator
MSGRRRTGTGENSAARRDGRRLSELEKRLINSLQEDLPVVDRPFAVVARRLDMAEEELLDRVRQLVADGTIRRFGATLRHQHSGYEANAMVVWQVEPGEVERVGEIFASFREVTHCYQRLTLPGWPFSLFTMVHGRSRSECRQIARRMAAEAGVDRYRLLFTVEELKKTTMAYFSEDR